MMDTTLKSERIGLIGIFPPPSGGQGFYNIHLYEELRRRGWPVIPINVSGTARPSTQFVYAPTRIALIRELMRDKYGCFLLTASDSRHIGFEFLTAFACKLRHKPFFYNILAGRFADRFRSYDRGHRIMLRFALKQARLIFASNEDQARHIIDLTDRPATEIRVIGCRTPVGNSIIENPELIQFIQSGEPGIVSVGSMRDAYGFPLLIRACGKLADSGFKPSVLLVISGDEDPITYERVHAAIAETRGTVSVKIHHELPRDEVLGAVRAADLLVRPTRFDGDSLTIHEAIQLGTPVVASDAAPRPPGVHIHITDDSDSLRDIMIQAIRSPAPEPSTLRDIDPVDRLERALQENAVNWSV